MASTVSDAAGDRVASNVCEEMVATDFVRRQKGQCKCDECELKAVGGFVVTALVEQLLMCVLVGKTCG